ncbi:hypothetical protein BJX96DRAFT_59340 [Aspergillus floccosus]
MLTRGRPRTRGWMLMPCSTPLLCLFFFVVFRFFPSPSVQSCVPVDQGSEWLVFHFYNNFSTRSSLSSLRRRLPNPPIKPPAIASEARIPPSFFNQRSTNTSRNCALFNSIWDLSFSQISHCFDFRGTNQLRRSFAPFSFRPSAPPLTLEFSRTSP